MIGSFLYLGFFFGLLWHTAYLLKHGNEPESTTEFAVLEWFGPLGLFCNWCFIFFLTSRLNSNVRHLSNPRFSDELDGGKGYD